MTLRHTDSDKGNNGNDYGSLDTWRAGADQERVNGNDSGLSVDPN